MEECQGLAERSRDLHLGDADLLGDLGLGQLVEEPQREDGADPGRQLGQ